MKPQFPLSLYINNIAKFVKENVVTFALNSISRNRKGEAVPSVSEMGNINVAEIPGTIIGSVYMTDDEIAIFSVDGNDSIIGILDKTQNYTLVVQSSTLNFSVNNPIKATYRVRRGCQRTIYWVDGRNTVRIFDFDDVDEFKTSGVWDANKFRLIKNYERPCLSARVVTGGGLKSGSYNFFIQWLDEDLNPTIWIDETQPISVYRDDQTSSYHQISGSVNVNSNPNYGFPRTSKSIEITVNNPDTRFKYYRIAIAEATSAKGIVTRVIATPPQLITSPTIVYDGYPENSGYTLIPKEDLNATIADLSVADHIEQIENRLLIASTKAKQVNYCTFQQYASKISGVCTVRTVNVKDANQLGNSKNPLTQFESQGFQPGEVQPFGIVYVFDDGSESPVCPLIGPNRKGFKYNGAIVNWASSLLPYGLITNWTPDIEHLIPVTDAANTPNYGYRNWRIYDTSFNIDTSKWSFSYHETLNSVYPPRDTCAGDDYWGVDSYGETLTGKKIRHFRFPSRNEIEIMSSNFSLSGTSALKINASLISGSTFAAGTIQIDYTKFGVVKQKIYNVTSLDDLISLKYLIVDSESATTIGVFDNILVTTSAPLAAVTTVIVSASLINMNVNDEGVQNILGVEFSNIEYPHPDIVSHYFTTAQRTDSNTTVIDSGYLGKMLEGDTDYSPTTDEFEQEKFITFTTFTHNCYESNFVNSQIGCVAHNVMRERLYSERHHWLITPKHQFTRNIQTPHYIKIEGYYKLNDTTAAGITGREINDVYDGGGIVGKDDGDINLDARVQYYDTFVKAPKASHLATDTLAIGGQGINIKLDKFLTLAPLDYKEEYENSKKLLYNLSQVNAIKVVSTVDNPLSGKFPASQFENHPFAYTLNAPSNSSHERNIFYVTLRLDKDVYTDLDSIVYYKIHNCNFTASSLTTKNQVFGGDIYTSYFPIFNTEIRKHYESKIGALISAFAYIVSYALSFIPVVGAVLSVATTTLWKKYATPNKEIKNQDLSTDDNTAKDEPDKSDEKSLNEATGKSGAIISGIIGVAVGITEALVSAFGEKSKKSKLKLMSQDGEVALTSTLGGILDSDSFGYLVEALVGTYIDSSINVGLRCKYNLTDCSEYYDGRADILDYASRRLIALEYFEDGSEKTQYRLRGVPCPETYIVNHDYSRKQSEVPKYSLPITYDCCTNCLETFPNRIWYSEQSFQEELVDNYRLILPNNYRDIENELGNITNIFRVGENVYIHLAEQLLYLPYSLQERVTDEVVTFIGAGEFFAIPPKQLQDSTLGTFGSVDKFATVKTSAGVFFASEKDQTFYWFDGKQAKDIGEEIRAFLDIHYVVKAKSLPGTFGINSIFGKGYIAVEDKMYNRILVTKRDYIANSDVFLYNQELPDPSSEYTLCYDVNGGYYFVYNINRTITLVDESNFDTYFTSKAWTLSFDYKAVAWKSFHSYKPSAYVASPSFLYSFVNSSNYLWQHHKESYFTFYGEKSKYVLEMTIGISNDPDETNPLGSKILNYFSIRSDAKKYSSDNMLETDQRYTFFNRAMIHNSTQGSGWLELLPKNVDDVNQMVVDTLTHISKTDKEWNINNFRNMVDNYTVPVTNGEIIDKDFFPAVINPLKSHFEIETFSDTFVVIRLEFDSVNDTELNVTSITAYTNSSFR